MRPDMRLRLQRLRSAALTPVGRHKFSRHLLLNSLWPYFGSAADVHRRTLASKTRIVAVVGSVGKSTSAKAVAAALGKPTPKTMNARGGVALAMLRIRPWQRHAVIEVGINGPGQMIRYARMVRPDVVVVTAIASEHNRSFASLDHTRDEKALMLTGLRPGGLAVLNGDDHRVRSMASSTHARVLTFGMGADNDVRASEVSLDWPHGTRVKVEVEGRTLEFRMGLLGRVMVYPVLAAIAVAWAAGRPLDEVVRALEAMAPQSGRLQLVRVPNDVWVIRDDYKASLETIHAALDLLADVPGRRIAVLGEIQEPPGSQGPHYRHLGGRLASIVSHAIIVGSKNCFQSYAAGAVRAGLPRAALVHTRSVDEAIEAVRADLRPGDVLLIKGRSRQRLERVALALQGKTIACTIDDCTLEGMRCHCCPMLGPAVEIPAK